MILDFLVAFWGLLEQLKLVSEDTISFVIIMGLFYVALHRFQFNRIFKTHAEIKDEILDIHNASMEMQKCLDGNFENYTPIHMLEKLRWSTPHSPLDLNEAGEKLFKESKMDELMKGNMPKLIKLLDERKPDNRLDAQKLSFDILAKYIIEKKELLRQIKEFVYEHPKFEGNELNVADIIYVGSLVLRDEYLEKHSELGLSGSKENK